MNDAKHGLIPFLVQIHWRIHGQIRNAQLQRGPIQRGPIQARKEGDQEGGIVVGRRGHGRGGRRCGRCILIADIAIVHHGQFHILELEGKAVGRAGARFHVALEEIVRDQAHCLGVVDVRLRRCGNVVVVLLISRDRERER